MTLRVVIILGLSADSPSFPSRWLIILGTRCEFITNRRQSTSSTSSSLSPLSSPLPPRYRVSWCRRSWVFIVVLDIHVGVVGIDPGLADVDIIVVVVVIAPGTKCVWLYLALSGCLVVVVVVVVVIVAVVVARDNVAKQSRPRADCLITLLLLSWLFLSLLLLMMIMMIVVPGVVGVA